MEKKVNLVELLRHAPSGMELDCVLFDDSVKVIFDKVDETLGFVKIVVIRKNNRVAYSVTKYGQWDSLPYHKCVIFPKGKTTWEGFVPPCKFKDGDILFVESVYNWIIIYKESENDEKLHKYVAISDKPNSTYMVYDNNLLSALCYKEEISKIRFATEEEKDKLFNVIKDKGYRWNEESKTLEELTESKFKDGDILYCDANDCGENDDRFKYVFIFDKLEDGKYYYSHCHLYGGEFYDGKTFLVNNNYPVRFATEEEKEKLFKVMNYNGYKWNTDTKSLEELDEPKFKPGDRIKRKDSPAVHAIKMIDTDLYIFDDLQSIPISVQGDYELVPKKFDVNTLKPFDRVLVRSYDSDEWSVALWGHLKEKHDMRYDTTRGTYRRCIPYEGNEHLLGKTDDCGDYYHTW